MDDITATTSTTRFPAASAGISSSTVDASKPGLGTGVQEDHFAGSTVLLNVGGYRHCVPVVTLEKIPYFQPMLRGTHPPKMEVDRDGAAFGEVVTFAAAGETFAGRQPSSLHILRDEADFYSYDTLLEELTLLPFRLATQSTPSAHTSMSLAIALSAIGSTAESDSSRVARSAEAMQILRGACGRLLRGLDVDAPVWDQSLRVQTWHLDYLEACWQIQLHANASLASGQQKLRVAQSLGRALTGGPPQTHVLLAVAGELPLSLDVTLSIAQVARGMEGDAAPMLPILRLVDLDHPATTAAQRSAVRNATIRALLAAHCEIPAHLIIRMSDPTTAPSFDLAALTVGILRRKASALLLPAERREELDGACRRGIGHLMNLAGQKAQEWAQIAELTYGTVMGGETWNQRISLQAAIRAADCPDATWRDRLALVERCQTEAGPLTFVIPAAAKRAAGRLTEDGAPGTWLRAKLLLAAARLLQVCGWVDDAVRLAREAASTVLRHTGRIAEADLEEAISMECEILFQEGRYGLAEEAARRALTVLAGRTSSVWLIGFLSALRRGDLDAVQSLLALALAEDTLEAAQRSLLQQSARLDGAILDGRPEEVMAAAAQLARADPDSSPLLELKVAGFFAHLPNHDARRKTTAAAAWVAVDEQEQGDGLDLQDALAMLRLARTLPDPDRARQAMASIAERLPRMESAGNGCDLAFMALEEARSALACGQPEQARLLCRMIREGDWQHMFAQRSAAAILRQTGDVREADEMERLVARRLEEAEAWGPALARPEDHLVCREQGNGVASTHNGGVADPTTPGTRGAKRKRNGAGSPLGQNGADPSSVLQRGEASAPPASATPPRIQP